MSKKRGQITVFIILGIIILMTSATFFYVQNRLSTIDPSKILDRDATPIHPFIESCLEITTREAMDRVGITGGYIDFPDAINNDPASYLKISGIDEAKMPYWWYAGHDRIPPLDYIEEQVEEYIEKNIDLCLDNFSAIKEYDIYKLGNTSVDVTFADIDIAINMAYPIRAVKIPEQNEFKLEGKAFFARVPIRFKEVYETAAAIMEDENQGNFMEHWTMDLISLADNPNTEYETPLTGINFRLRPYTWKILEVTNNLKTLLSANAQYIKFGQVDYNPIPDIFPYMQNHYIWNFDEEHHPGIRASVIYDEKWPTRVHISPTKAGILKSGQTKFSRYIPFVGIQTWHFTYDLVYPVIISIYDESGRRNDEYSFQYAFLVSIQKNTPNRDSFGSTIFDTTDQATTDEMCEYLTEEFEVPITVQTFNEHNNDPIRNVELTFICGRYTCPIGKTDWTSHGASASITSNFPFCSNGILRGTKEGYEDAEMFVSAEGAKTVQFKLRPVKEFTNYKVVKHYYVPQNLPVNQIGAEAELDDDEEAVIMINSGGLIDQYASYPSDEPLPIKFYKDKEFAYNVTIYLFNDEGLLGGYDGEIILDPRTVDENDFIKFHVLQYLSKDEEELALFLSGIKSYSKRISEPEFETLK